MDGDNKTYWQSTAGEESVIITIDLQSSAQQVYNKYLKSYFHFIDFWKPPEKI